MVVEVLLNLSDESVFDGKTELKLQVPSAGKIYLKFIYILKKDRPLHAAGLDIK